MIAAGSVRFPALGRLRLVNTSTSLDRWTVVTTLILILRMMCAMVTGRFRRGLIVPFAAVIHSP